MSENPTYILCIETANGITSVALSKDGICLQYKEILENNKAADTLHLLIQELLSEIRLSFSDLQAIAISSGPGSYTGLRIATAAAKGFCYALDIPLISISTLQAMVYGVQSRYKKTEEDFYIPIIDARRMEVFISFFTQDITIVKSFLSLILDEKTIDLFERNKKYLLFGNGAAKAKNLLSNDLIKIQEDFFPSSRDLCLFANSAYKQKKFEDIAYFEPNYFKAFYTTAKKQ